MTPTTIRELIGATLNVLETNDPKQPVVGMLRQYLEGCNLAFDKFAALGVRQREAAILMAKGYSALETGRAMGIGKRGAEQTRARVLEILEASSSAEVAVMAYRAGLLGDGEG